MCSSDLEPVPTIIIFMPLVNALTEAGSINPVHMGVVLIVTLAFGLITPPYGLVLLMAPIARPLIEPIIGTAKSSAGKRAKNSFWL